MYNYGNPVRFGSNQAKLSRTTQRFDTADHLRIVETLVHISAVRLVFAFS